MSNSPKAERAPWNNFPSVIRNGDLKELEKEPEYQEAKQGNSAAALTMALRLIRPETLESVSNLVQGQDVKIVPVLAMETAGENKLPLAMAEVLGDKLGLNVDCGIFQIDKVGRTNKGADHRLAFNPAFEGEVKQGQPYFIVDDTLTMGGTLASLRGYIENRGGHVLGAAVMTAHVGALNIAIKPSMVQGIEQKHGSAMDQYWKEEFGYGIRELTQGEAGHLKKSPSVDAIRDRIAQARNAEIKSMDEVRVEKTAGSGSGFIDQEQDPDIDHDLQTRLLKKMAEKRARGRADRDRER